MRTDFRWPRLSPSSPDHAYLPVVADEIVCGRQRAELAQDQRGSGQRASWAKYSSERIAGPAAKLKGGGTLRATLIASALDELLSDAVMAPVLRSAGYEPDGFRDMMTEMAWKSRHAVRGR